jgi:hypothetical protein
MSASLPTLPDNLADAYSKADSSERSTFCSKVNASKVCNRPVSQPQLILLLVFALMLLGVTGFAGYAMGKHHGATAATNVDSKTK